jgi:hypothetical protein
MDDSANLLVAADVARGVARMLVRHDLLAIAEVPLGNGRRADLMALSSKGEIVIVEVKTSKADLLGDNKWREYLEYCDRYFWAIPQGFDIQLFDRPDLMPGRAGLIVADRYDAAILREAEPFSLAAGRRRAETLRFARRAARRLICADEGGDEII